MSDIVRYSSLVKKVLSKNSKEYKTVTEISGATGLSSGLIVDILHSMEEDGIVEHTIRTTKYGVKITVYRLKKKTLLWKEKLTTL